MSGTLDCEHTGGIGNGTPCIVVASVDFYNFTTNEETHIALRSLNADKEHQGGTDRMEAYGMNTQEGGSMCQVLTELFLPAVAIYGGVNE